GATLFSSTPYIAYRLPDLHLTFTAAPIPDGGADNQSGTQVLMTGLSRTGAGIAPFQADIEYQDANGKWIPYQYWLGNGDAATWLSNLSVWGQTIGLGGTTGGVNDLMHTAPVTASHDITPYTLAAFLTLDLTPPSGGVYTRGGFFHVSDPRSIRFTPQMFTQDQGAAYESGSFTNAAALWPTSTSNTRYAASGYGGTSNIGAQQIPPIFGSASWPATLARNNAVNSALVSSYPDFYGSNGDKVQRIGDSGLFPATTSASAGNPYARTVDRPVVLNRPFNGVGELGYAFRDGPWRSLDFFTANSADAGLLDLFTLECSTNTVLQGRVSLNTPYPQVLEALFNNTSISPAASPLTAASTMGAGQTNLTYALAQSITNATSATPLVNKAQLATVVSPVLPAGAFSSSDEQNVKISHEGFVRALADVGQTRTWNLMIDLVAQTGRYPATATASDQFLVEGEKRYWLHIAIDRVTGEILDERLEEVSQ
ncbi:MAG TPA: hypothetical protein VIM58_06270, partial [Candidatus Methylacidiphilales bacterium]